MTNKPAETFYDPNAQTPAPKKRGPKPKVREPEQSGLTHLAAIKIDSADPSMTADLGLMTPTDEREILKADVARIRAMRKPFGAFSQKLALPQRPGYHRHWFSDEPGRVDEAKSNGWAQVSDNEGKPIKRVVGRGRDGGAMYGYAMELPNVFWEEDQQAKNDAAQARLDDIKKAPFRAKPGQAQKSDADKFYSARDEPIQMTQSSVRTAPRS